ncbi:hypothetical protein QTO34_019364 [Cnephaeus nilssonii]|uniref:Transcriptional activator Zfx/Zfy domain-containing protein n=1 Tax=Cnephaeus nilssonii TaxID=3371016 RepID=A0AA40HWR9_CNENI|nr:hypothetical protein QTO34_019364 [Eptesicus nilssonii]
MVCMTVNDPQQEDEDLSVAEIADEVYYGREEGAAAAVEQVPHKNSKSMKIKIKTFLPVVWQQLTVIILMELKTGMALQMSPPGSADGLNSNQRKGEGLIAGSTKQQQ